MRILTVGHSTHDGEAFTALLRGAGVRLVADVRLAPGSRRHPHMAAAELARWLPASGIGYEHLRDLGGRRRPVRGSPNDAWEHEAFRGYADHMATPAFAAALGRLEALAVERLVAVMCAEALWWRCHRRLVADALVARGWPVAHLGRGGRVEEHRLPPFAVVEDRRVTYPRQPPLA